MKNNKQPTISETITGLMPFVLAMALFIFMFIPLIELRTTFLNQEIFDEVNTLKIIFGDNARELSFNFLLLLAFILPLIIAVLTIVIVFLKKRTAEKILSLLLALTFVFSFAAILMITSIESRGLILPIKQTFSQAGYTLNNAGIAALIISGSGILFSSLYVTINMVKK